MQLAILDLDRCSHKRIDQQWIDDQFRSKNSRIVPIHNSLVLCDVQQCLATFITFDDLDESIEKPPIFLGLADGVAFFSIDITSAELASTLSMQNNAEFIELRAALSLLNSFNADLLALARFTIHWHAKTNYCGKCGRLTKVSEAGHARTCSNDKCGEKYYPNMDPAIIVFVSSGDRCLLGRQKEWKEGVYSTLAGFVEPGETIEQAVIREVKEESNITVNNVKYVQSQPWLFPNALMLGFTAEAVDEDITICEEELEDVAWFTKDQIRSNPELLPFKHSIAYKLIMQWLV